MARHLIQALASRNLAAGDRVCVTSPNSRDYLTVIDMCLRSGIQPVLVSASATERDIGEMSADLGARAVLAEHEIHAFGHLIFDRRDRRVAQSRATCVSHPSTSRRERRADRKPCGAVGWTRTARLPG